MCSQQSRMCSAEELNAVSQLLLRDLTFREVLSFVGVILNQNCKRDFSLGIFIL